MQQPHGEPGARNHAMRAPLGVGAAEQCASPPALRLACGLRGPAQTHQSSHLREAGAMRQPHGEPSVRRNHAMRARPPSAARPRTRSGSRAACTAQLRCIRAVTCARPARCSQPHGEPGARRSHAVRARPPSAAPPRTRSGWHATCAAQLRCIRTLAGASLARCSSLTARLAPGVITPGARGRPALRRPDVDPARAPPARRCSDASEQSPARVWRDAAASRRAERPT